jgi:hypothetical protein
MDPASTKASTPSTLAKLAASSWIVRCIFMDWLPDAVHVVQLNSNQSDLTDSENQVCQLPQRD